MTNNFVIKTVKGIKNYSRFIIEKMCEHAAEYGVDEQAINQAYELWPFERQDDFEQISHTLSKKLNSENTSQLALKNYDNQINQLENKVDSKIDHAIGLLSDKEVFEDIHRQLADLNTKTEQLSTVSIPAKINISSLPSMAPLYTVHPEHNAATALFNQFEHI